jgi:hypothetical protein
VVQSDNATKPDLDSTSLRLRRARVHAVVHRLHDHRFRKDGLDLSHARAVKSLSRTPVYFLSDYVQKIYRVVHEWLYGPWRFDLDGAHIRRGTAARKVLGWPRRRKLAHAFLWECSYIRLQLAHFLGQPGVVLT